MFHVKHSWLLLIFTPLFIFSQGNFKIEDKDFAHNCLVDSVVFKHVERELRGKGLTENEKAFFYWSCYVRKYPNKFLTEIIIPFTANFPEVNGLEVESLKLELRNLKSIPMFSFDLFLRQASMEHANDLSQRSAPISHMGSDGTGFSSRMQRFGIRKCASENIYTGKNDGLLALIMLLLDIGVESLGHRKNILNPNHLLMGVSIKSHRFEQRSVLVQVLGCR
jgi:hypothetical protein